MKPQILPLSLLSFLLIPLAGCEELEGVMWTPSDGSISTDTGSPDTGEDEPVYFDIQDQALSFEGTLPGAETLDACEDCYRELYMDSSTHRVAVTIFHDDGSRDSKEFTYLERGDGQYDVELLYAWTAAEATSPVLSNATGYLIIEPKNGVTTVVDLYEPVVF